MWCRCLDPISSPISFSSSCGAFLHGRHLTTNAAHQAPLTSLPWKRRRYVSFLYSPCARLHGVFFTGRHGVRRFEWLRFGSRFFLCFARSLLLAHHPFPFFSRLQVLRASSCCWVLVVPGPFVSVRCKLALWSVACGLFDEMPMVLSLILTHVSLLSNF